MNDELKRFVLFFMLLSVLSVAIGFCVNAFREKPLPLVYRDKAERLAEAVERLTERGHSCPQRLDVGSEKTHEESNASTIASAESAVGVVDSGQECPRSVVRSVLDFDEMKKIVEAGDMIILDARPELFHRLGHIPGALSLPRDEFEEGYLKIKETLEADKDRPLVIYCANDTCEDGKLVIDALKKLGYTNISIYIGGWSEWEKGGLH